MNNIAYYNQGITVYAEDNLESLTNIEQNISVEDDINPISTLNPIIFIDSPSGVVEN